MALKSTAFLVLALAILYKLYQNWTAVPVPQVQGSCTAAFKGVEKAYRAGFDSGKDVGSSLAIYHKGELVCDMWGGWADESNHIPWSTDSRSIVFSSTKGVSAITFALLYERGLFDYKDLVSKYWPEFAQNGKEEITIAQLASHQAGLAALDEDLTLEDIRERPDKVSKAIENQKPNWPPGTAHGYHALTFTLGLDQLVRRIDPAHRGLDQFFREEIAEPYGIELDIGMPYEMQWRSTRLVIPSDFSSYMKRLTNFAYISAMFRMIHGADEIMKRSFTCPQLDPREYNWPETRATPLGSALGSGSARGVAKLYSIVADPQHHDKRLLSDETFNTLVKSQTGERREKFFDINSSFGLGVFLTKVGQNHLVFHHPGYGGQVGAGIPDLDIGWSYVTNYLGFALDSFEDERVQPVYKSLMEALEKL